MATHDIIVIGASAGGVEALTQFVRALPADLPAAIFIVLHIAPYSKSLLPNILNRRCSLTTTHAVDGEEIQPGHIYIAPPDHHLLIKNGYIHISRGPRENRHRPAVDPLFRTAARTYGPRVVGVVLSGTLDDGTAGLLAIKSRGGIAIVQNPEEALYDGMPRSAIDHVEVDHILPISEIVSLLVELARKPVPEQINPVNDNLAMEADMAELDKDAVHSDQRPGKESPYSCPECGGVLWELNQGNLLRFRCRTGHAYSPKSFLAEQSYSVEQALWSALRALKEQSNLVRRMAERAKKQNHPLIGLRYEQQAQEAEFHAETLRKLLLDGNKEDEPLPEN